MKWKTKYTSSYLATNMNIRKSLLEENTSKYPDFDYLDAKNKLVFLFHNIDAFICKKKLAQFIYEAFTLRNESIDTRIAN